MKKLLLLIFILTLNKTYAISYDSTYFNCQVSGSKNYKTTSLPQKVNLAGKLRYNTESLDLVQQDIFTIVTDRNGNRKNSVVELNVNLDFNEGPGLGGKIFDFIELNHSRHWYYYNIKFEDFSSAQLKKILIELGVSEKKLTTLNQGLYMDQVLETGEDAKGWGDEPGVTKINNSVEFSIEIDEGLEVGIKFTCDTRRKNRYDGYYRVSTKNYVESILENRKLTSKKGQLSGSSLQIGEVIDIDF